LPERNHCQRLSPSSGNRPHGHHGPYSPMSELAEQVFLGDDAHRWVPK
jgi:hypothetical protein